MSETYFHPELGYLSDGAAFVLEVEQFPAGWLADATNAARRAELGFILAVTSDRPEIAGQVVTGHHWTDDHVQVWDTRPETGAETNARIKLALAEVDLRSVRPQRAVLAALASGGAADPADLAKLAALAAEADELRNYLQGT